MTAAGGQLIEEFVDISSIVGPLETKLAIESSGECGHASCCQTVDVGLTFEGKCFNESCPTSAKTPDASDVCWYGRLFSLEISCVKKLKFNSNLGFGVFLLSNSDLLSSIVCPTCKTPFPPRSCGFHQCQYRFIGQKNLRKSPASDSSMLTEEVETKENLDEKICTAGNYTSSTSNIFNSGWQFAEGDLSYYCYNSSNNNLAIWEELMIEVRPLHVCEPCQACTILLDGSEAFCKTVCCHEWFHLACMKGRGRLKCPKCWEKQQHQLPGR